METFEERYNVTEVYRELFKSLCRDNAIPELYYITLDENFVDRFYAKSDKDAIERFKKV